MTKKFTSDVRCRLPEDVLEQVRRLADGDQCSVSAVVRRAVRDYLERKEPEVQQ